MRIILTNFSTHKFFYTNGETLKDAIHPWIKNENAVVNPTANILDVLSGTGFSKEDFDNLRFKSTNVLPFDIRGLFNIADSGKEPLYLNKDWILDYENANDFKFCPYCYSFKSNSRRFYVLNLNGQYLILSNYRGSWSIIPLKFPSDNVGNYVPICLCQLPSAKDSGLKV